MSGYIEDYKSMTYEEKVWILQQIWKTVNKESRDIIIKEIQKLYNENRGR